VGILHRPSPAGMPLSPRAPRETAFRGSAGCGRVPFRQRGAQMICRDGQCHFGMRALPIRGGRYQTGIEEAPTTEPVLSGLSRPGPRRGRCRPGARCAPPDARGGVRARFRPRRSGCFAPVATGRRLPLIDPSACPSKSAAMRKRSGSHKMLIVSGDKV
jgi:hypothetical protein